MQKNNLIGPIELVWPFKHVLRILNMYISIDESIMVLFRH